FSENFRAAVIFTREFFLGGVRGVYAAQASGSGSGSGSVFENGRVEESGKEMAATMKKAAVEDVNVTFEDQQKINKFARNNNRLIELKEEIELKKKQLQNLEDACDDIMMLDDDTMLVPYQIGEVFISHSQDETQEMLEAAKQSFQDEIQALQTRVETIQQVLSDLKVQLYAKFGNNINLEAEDN
ncbi:hypothetical protein chiPu_0003732, partial [Chiloscyllium punctatum]|nr:hypothetical protein [Chiloscyllium punctatum]